MHEKVSAFFFLLAGAALAFLYEPTREPHLPHGEAVPPSASHLERFDGIRRSQSDSAVMARPTNQVAKLEVPSPPLSIPKQPAENTPSGPTETESPVPVFRSGPSTSKIVALTFDDGPHRTITPKVLEQLRQRNIKATFFVLGDCVKRHPAILRQIAAEGHEIGNHTYSHRILKFMTNDLIDREITETQNQIKAAIGCEPCLFRPPYGSFRPDSREIFHQHNLSVILWSVDPRDWRIRDEERIFQAVTTQTQNGSIILCHDIYNSTLQALPRILDALLAEGYQFTTVSELCGLTPMKLATAPSPKPPSPK